MVIPRDIDLKAQQVLDLTWNNRLPVTPARLAPHLFVTKGQEQRIVSMVQRFDMPYSGHVDYDEPQRTYRCHFNGAEDDIRQRFAQAHLLGHVVLGHVLPGRLTPDTHYSIEQQSRVEREANHFAAALLIPEMYLRVAIQRHQCVDTLSRLFGVSSTAIRHRLIGLGIL